MNRRKFLRDREEVSRFSLPPWERMEAPRLQQLRQQQQKARISELLTADAMTLGIVAGGFNYVGWGISGTWVGTLYFEAVTTDNPNTWITDSQQPFPSGTAVTSTTANGNFFSQVAPNIIAKRVRFSRTSGSVQVIGQNSLDASFQDAYLAATDYQKSNTAAAGTQNSITFAAGANSAWNLTSLEVTLNGPQRAGDGVVKVYDGTQASGNVLFSELIPTAGGSLGFNYPCNLPTNVDGVQSVVGTPGNAMTVVLFGFQSAQTTLNGRARRA